MSIKTIERKHIVPGRLVFCFVVAICWKVTPTGFRFGWVYFQWRTGRPRPCYRPPTKGLREGNVSLVSVCSQKGPHDALDLTVQGSLAPAPAPPPSPDVRPEDPTIQTCSNLFIRPHCTGPCSPNSNIWCSLKDLRSVQAGGTHPTGTLLSCFRFFHTNVNRIAIYAFFILHGNQFKPQLWKISLKLN